MTLAAVTTYRLTRRGGADWEAGTLLQSCSSQDSDPTKKDQAPNVNRNPLIFMNTGRWEKSGTARFAALGQPDLASSSQEPSLRPQRQIPF